MRNLIISTFIIISLTGCFRTEYANVLPKEAPMSVPVSPEAINPLSRSGGWQSFFIYGWVPGEKVINATAACGSAEDIGVIKTQRTFLEGLVAAIAGFYINIYSPWDGAVYCRKG